MVRTSTPLSDPTFLEIEGSRIATYVLEPAGRPAVGDVVLCHGTPWSAQVWAEVALALKHDHRVFAWDMPGYGRSDQGQDVPVDLVHQQRRLAALMQHWALDRSHVVAHDIGGAVALGAHLHHGVDYRSLFLLDIVTLEPWGSPFFQLVAQNEAVFAALPERLHGALVREYIAGAAHGPLESVWIETLARPWQTTSGQAAFYRQISQLRVAHTRPIAADLDRVRCPVRLGWGENDPWIPLEQAGRLADLLPGRPDVAVFADTGHLAPIESVIRELRRWL